MLGSFDVIGNEGTPTLVSIDERSWEFTPCGGAGGGGFEFTDVTIGEATCEREPLEPALERMWNQASDLVNGACEERKVPFGGGLYFSFFGRGEMRSFGSLFREGSISNSVDHFFNLSEICVFAGDLVDGFLFLNDLDFRLFRLDADDALELLLLECLEREDLCDDEELRLARVRVLMGRGIIPSSPPRACAITRTLSAIAYGEAPGSERRR